MGAWIEICCQVRNCVGDQSLLSWERGLKCQEKKKVCIRVLVAPLVGAWIEIMNCINAVLLHKVAPLVGAWIEIKPKDTSEITGIVAPLVGAWIEIGVSSKNYDSITVAPLVGAWIEILVQNEYDADEVGRSSRGSVD